MTLVIAAEGDDFVIVASDSRVTVEDAAGTKIQNDNMRKLIPITKYVCVLVSGDGGAGKYLIDKFQRTVKPKNKDVTEIAQTFSLFCRKEFKEFYHTPRTKIPSFGFIIAGLDKINGKYKMPCIYSTDSEYNFCLDLSEHFEIQGKPIIALYMFAKMMPKNNKVGVNQLSELVAQSMYDTTMVDNEVGGNIKMGVIDSGGFRDISKDFKSLIEEWDIKHIKKISES